MLVIISNIIKIMSKKIEDDLIELSITNLMQCLGETEYKDKFIKEIPDAKYSKIVKFMREESTVIQMRDFHNWIKLVLITNISNVNVIILVQKNITITIFSKYSKSSSIYN